MAQTRIELNDSGIRGVLRGTEVRQIVTAKAADIASRCGSGYVAAAPHDTGQRAAVNIYPESNEAYQDNLENNTLLRELYK